jgi:hypothetical protein
VTNKLLIVTDLGVFKAYKPQFGRLLSKLLDETSAGDESARIRVPGSAMLEVWPWSLFARARGARRPASKAFK